MSQFDQPVRISSQSSTLRSSLVVGGTAVSETLYCEGLPRVFLNARQTVGGAAGTLAVEWAIRASQTTTIPEWLLLQTILLNPLPVNTPVSVLFTVGAIWMRFTLTGAAADRCELGASAFV